MDKRRTNFKYVITAVKHYLGNECIYCGRKDGLVIHHRIPVYCGGDDRLGNFELVCSKCHTEVHKQWRKIRPYATNLIELECSLCGKKITRRISTKNRICKSCQNKKEYRRRKEKGSVRVLFILVLFFFVSMISMSFASKTPQEGSHSLSDCFLEPIAPHYIPYVETHGALIDCLVEKESSNNPEAINPRDVDGKPKYGLLQFGEATWKENCVDKYGLPDSIMDEGIQRECADRLIEDGEAWRWGTLFKCI